MLNHEVPQKRLSTVLRQVLEKWSRAYLHTGMPGIIDTYNATTRRASVRPALRLVMDGDIPGEDGEALERALAVNVPVMWPAGNGGSPNGMILAFPLQAGDRGMLSFSERGMTEFKATGELATPDKTRFFDQSDAVFYPGDFGHPTDPTIVDEDAASIQTYDGHTAILLKRGEIELKVGTSSVVLTQSTIEILAQAGSGRIDLNQ